MSHPSGFVRIAGKSIDTSMGFTATAGLPMMHPLWRSGPGLVSYLACTEQMTATQFQKIVNHESGMLGVSETSSDMGDLLSLEAGDVRAAEAVAPFCFQALTIPVFILAAAAESAALTQFRNTKTK